MEEVKKAKLNLQITKTELDVALATVAKDDLGTTHGGHGVEVGGN